MRRKVAQAEAQGERDGTLADVGEATGTVSTPENPAGHSSGRGMSRHTGLCHRTNPGQFSQRVGLPSEWNS